MKKWLNQIPQASILTFDFMRNKRNQVITVCLKPKFLTTSGLWFMLEHYSLFSQFFSFFHKQTNALHWKHFYNNNQITVCEGIDGATTLFRFNHPKQLQHDLRSVEGCLLFARKTSHNPGSESSRARNSCSVNIFSIPLRMKRITIN